MKSVFSLLRITYSNFLLLFLPTFKINSKNHLNKNQVSVISFFKNFSPKFRKGVWFSNYWNSVPELIKSKNQIIKWVHIIGVSHNPFHKLKIYLRFKFINNLNLDEDHFVIDKLISISFLFKIFLKRIRSQFYFNRFNSLLKNEIKRQENYWLWNFFEYNFENSFVGSTSIYSLYYNELFKKISKN